MNRITIDKYDTFPDELKGIISNKQIKLNEWYNMLYTCDIKGDLSYTINNITNYLETKNPKITIFHATRLLPYEIDDLYQNGYKIPTEDIVKSRLKKMCEYLNFDELIFERLFDAISIKTQNSNSKFYFIATLTTLCESGFHDLYKYWGGESIYFHSKKINFEIFEKISTHSIPCLLIGCLNYKDIDNKDWIAKKIIYFYVLQQLKKEVNVSNGFESTSSVIPDIIEILKYDNPLLKEYIGMKLFNDIK